MTHLLLAAAGCQTDRLGTGSPAALRMCCLRGSKIPHRTVPHKSRKWSLQHPRIFQLDTEPEAPHPR